MQEPYTKYIVLDRMLNLQQLVSSARSEQEVYPLHTAENCRHLVPLSQ